MSGSCSRNPSSGCSSWWQNRSSRGKTGGNYAGGMSMQFDTRPAAYAVIIRDAGILLAYWKQDGREGWTLPGGGLDLAEHPVDGCRREIHEETGYDAEVGTMLGI